MILDSKVIEYKGMPLFQKVRFKTPMDIQGTIEDFACFFYRIATTSFNVMFQMKNWRNAKQ